MGLQHHAEHGLSGLANLIGRFDDLDSAPFASATGVDLGLHHHGHLLELLGRPRRFSHGRRQISDRRGDPESAKELLGLVLVNLH